MVPRDVTAVVMQSQRQRAIKIRPTWHAIANMLTCNITLHFMRFLCGTRLISMFVYFIWDGRVMIDFFIVLLMYRKIWQEFVVCSGYCFSDISKIETK